MSSPFFPTNISPKQAKDTGMAMVLILLLAGLFTGREFWYQIAIPVLLVNMIWPLAFYPLAVIWLGLSHILGSAMSKILLSLIYLVLVLPTGVIRRMRGKDPLLLGQFGKNKESVMKTRNHTFTAEELERPY